MNTLDRELILEPLFAEPTTKHSRIWITIIILSDIRSSSLGITPKRGEEKRNEVPSQNEVSNKQRAPQQRRQPNKTHLWSATHSDEILKRRQGRIREEFLFAPPQTNNSQCIGDKE